MGLATNKLYTDVKNFQKLIFLIKCFVNILCYCHQNILNFIMKELITLFKEIYIHRELSVSKRFLPFTIFLTTGIFVAFIYQQQIFSGNLIPIIVFWIWILLLEVIFGLTTILLPHESDYLNNSKKLISESNWKAAEDLINKNFFIATPAFRIQHHLVKVDLYINKGLMLDALKILKRLSSKTLIGSEKNSVSLKKAWLFFDAGNYYESKIILKNIDKSKLLDDEYKIQHALLASKFAERNNDFRNAKVILEQLLNNNKLSNSNKAYIYYNLACLQETQSNINSAIGYYEKAWNYLKKDNHFYRIHNTANSLTLLYTRINENKKSYKILTEFEDLIDKDNPDQFLNFNNCKIQLARQLNDRKLLNQVYQNLSEFKIQSLTQAEALSIVVSELRMRFNDGVKFEDHLEKTMDQLYQSTILGLFKNIDAYIEVLGVIREAMRRANRPRSDLQIYYDWLIFQFVKQEEKLEVIQSKIPASLPFYQERWFKYKHVLIKAKFNLYPYGIPKKNIENLFETLTELKRISRDKDNLEAELKGLALILDEYIAYSDNFKQIKKDFGDLALRTLQEADELLQDNWQQPFLHKYKGHLSWYWYKIAENKNKSRYWMRKFDIKNLNLNHYAKWFQKQIEVTKKWLSN